MKKILAVVAVLVATTTATFAEVSVGVHGILGVGSNRLTGDRSGGILSSFGYDSSSPEFVVDGGFGLSARLGGAFGGTNKFLVGFQPELNFVFARTDKRTEDVGGGLASASVTATTSYNTLNIPLLLYLGGRINKLDFAFVAGPEIVVPLSSKLKTKLDGEVSALGLGAGGSKEFELFKLGGFGIGGTGGLDFAYNITEHHGVTLCYRFAAGVINPFRIAGPDTSMVLPYIDAANFSLGYRYTF